MATYPITPTSATLENCLTVAIPRDFRDSGWVQGTAVVRENATATNSKIFQSYDCERITRKINLSKVAAKTAGLVAATLATTDVLQIMPLSAGDVVVGGTLRVLTAASAGDTNTITVRVGATAISAAVSCLSTGITAVATAVPLGVTADDTVDFLLTGTNSPVFDAVVELTLYVSKSRA